MYTYTCINFSTNLNGRNFTFMIQKDSTVLSKPIKLSEGNKPHVTALLKLFLHV